MSVTALTPPPFKNQRGWLIAFGIAEILIGCLILLVMGIVAFSLHHLPANAKNPPDPRAMAMGAVMYGVIALVFVSIGIGNVQARRWARIAMQIVSWAWLVMGVLATAVLAVVVPKVMSTTPEQSAVANTGGAQRMGEIFLFSFFGVFFIVLPLIFVLFYSGRNVKATCELGAQSTAPSKPVPVLILSGWFALGAFGYLFIFVRPALPLLGLVVTGLPAFAAAAAMEAVTIWLAWNLYQQKPVAWKVAVGWLIFGWVSTLATIGRFGFAGMYRAMGYAELDIEKIESFTKFGVYSGFAVAVVFFVFLIATRKYYLDTPAPAK